LLKFLSEQSICENLLETIHTPPPPATPLVIAINPNNWHQEQGS